MDHVTSRIPAAEWNEAFGRWMDQLSALEFGHGASGWLLEEARVTDRAVIQVEWRGHGIQWWDLLEDAADAMQRFRADRGLARMFPPSRSGERTPVDWWIELHREIAAFPFALADFSPLRYLGVKRLGNVAWVTVTDQSVDEEIEFDLDNGFDPGVLFEIGEYYRGKAGSRG